MGSESDAAVPSTREWRRLHWKHQHFQPARATSKRVHSCKRRRGARRVGVPLVWYYITNTEVLYYLKVNVLISLA
jgi:hypothetical protein